MINIYISPDTRVKAAELVAAFTSNKVKNKYINKLWLWFWDSVHQ